MNGTEDYLFRLKSTMHGRLTASFAALFCSAAAAFALAYLIFSRINCGNFIIACDLSGSFFEACVNAMCSQMPCAVMLLSVYLSAFSSLSEKVSFFVCIWRGLCLGTTVSLILKGSVGGVASEWKISILFYFAATVGIIAFASVTSLYSAAITYTFASGDKRYFRSLAAEYTKCFLIASGAVFIFGCASAVFI